MLQADVISFQEFVMNDPLPLAKIQEAVFEFLRGRDDSVLFGAQAVNAYVSEPRATQDVDIISNRAGEFAEELSDHLSYLFRIAVRVREVKDKGFRIYQTRKEGNRHLVDVRVQKNLPESRAIENVRVLTPIELIVSKVLSYEARRGKPKAGTDWRDLGMLLIRFPELKTVGGEVSQLLENRHSSEFAIDFWRDLVEQDFRVEDDDDLIF